MGVGNMNKELLFLTELDDNKVEQLLAYSSYNDNSLDSIKSKVKQKTASKRIRGVKRIFIIAAVLILGAGAVVAATIDFDRAYQFLFGTQAEFMHNHGHHKGIVKEADGIEVELVSIMRYEHELVMIVAVRDVVADRLDRSIDLPAVLTYIENGIRRELEPNTSMNDFDEQNKTHFLIMIFNLPNNISVDEFSLEIPYIASRFEWVQEKMPSLNLYEIVSNHVPTIVIDDDDVRNRERLKIGELHIPFFANADWTYISNMGFVGGRFHIQIRNDTVIDLPDILLNHQVEPRIQITPWLVESNGTRHGRDRFGSPNVGKRYLSPGYFEYIFRDINDIEQLKGTAFEKFGMGFTEFFDGKWAVAFALPEEIDLVTIPINEKILLSESEKIFLEKVVITPLSVNMVFLLDEDVEQLDWNAVYKTFDDFYDWPFITYDDGTTVHIHFTIKQLTPLPCPFDSGRREINFRNNRRSYLLDDFGINRAIELDKIQSFTIQGMEFKVD